MSRSTRTRPVRRSAPAASRWTTSRPTPTSRSSRYPSLEPHCCSGWASWELLLSDGNRMNPSPGGAVEPPNKRLWLILVAVLAATGIGADCEGPPQPPAVVPPTVTLTVNGIPDDMNDLLVLPTTGFVVNVGWQAGDYPVDPSSYGYVRAERWGGGYASWVLVEL